QFLAAHAGAVYDKITKNRNNFVRVEDVMAAAAEVVPGLVPSKKDLAADGPLALKDKEGHEIDQGLLLSHLLADPAMGEHLCHAMRLPLPKSIELLPKLMRDGSLDLGRAMLTRQGKASIVEIRNARYLNAMDDSTIEPLETAVDLAIMDPETDIAVMRGGV